MLTKALLVVRLSNYTRHMFFYLLTLMDLPFEPALPGRSPHLRFIFLDAGAGQWAYWKRGCFKRGR